MTDIHSTVAHPSGTCRRRARSSRVRISLPAILALAMGCGSAQSAGQLEWCPDFGQSATVSIAAAEEPLGVLEEEWETPLLGPEWLIEEPMAFAADPVSGRIAISDHARTRVTVLDRSGTAQWQWPRDGRPVSGLVIPASLRWEPSGALEVLDPVLGTVFVLDSAGRSMDEWRLNALWFADLDAVRLIHAGVIGMTRLHRTATSDSIYVTQAIVRVQFPTGHRDTIEVFSSVVPAGARGLVGTAGEFGSAAVTTAGDSLVMFGGEIPEMRVRMTTVSGAPVRALCRVSWQAPQAAESGRMSSLGQQTAQIESPAQVAGLLAIGGRVWVRRKAAESALVKDQWFGEPGASLDVFGLSGDYEGAVRAPDSMRIVAGYGDTVIGFRERVPRGISVVAMRVRFLEGRDGQSRPR